MNANRCLTGFCVSCLVVTLFCVFPDRAMASGSLTNMEENFSQWHIFYDQGYTAGTLLPVSQPSLSGIALQGKILNGTSYAGIHLYQNLPPDPDATQFAMSLAFYFPDNENSQALEFAMNKWMDNTRWEWALQWQAVGDGTFEQGDPPTWRIWNGFGWQNLGFHQELAADTWHTFTLTGEIRDGKVRYLTFSCDQLQRNISYREYAPIWSPGDKLAVAVQLNGNPSGHPHHMYIDTIDFSWQ